MNNLGATILVTMIGLAVIFGYFIHEVNKNLTSKQGLIIERLDDLNDKLKVLTK